MGTNYYAEWTPPQGGDGPALISHPTVTVRMHICKSLTMFQGSVFNSWAAWKNFLTRNEWDVVITDEYGEKHHVDDFVRDVEATPMEHRSRQYGFLVRNGYDLSKDWLDLDGFSFTAGEFS